MNKKNLEILQKMMTEYISMCNELFDDFINHDEGVSNNPYLVFNYLKEHYGKNDLFRKILIPGKSDLIGYKIDYMFNQVKSFWKSNSKKLMDLLSELKLNGFCVRDENDVSASSDYVQRLLLYYDCVFISDSTMNLNSEWEILSSDEKTLYLFTFIKAKSYSRIMTKNTDIPLVIFYPLHYAKNDCSLYRQTESSTKNLVFESIEDIFKIDFNEIISLAKTKNGNVSLVNYVNKELDVELLLRLLSIHFESVNKAQTFSYKREFDPLNLPDRIKQKELLTTDIELITDLLANAFIDLSMKDLDASFLFADSPRQDRLHNIREYRQKLVVKKFGKLEDYTTGEILDYSFRNNFTSWRELSINDCISLRTGGYLDEMRNEIRNKKLILKTCNEIDFVGACGDFENCINEYLKEESQKVNKEYSNIKKKFGLSIASFIANILLTGSSFFLPQMGFIGAFVGVIAGPKSIKDTINDYGELTKFKESINNRPCNFLLSD